MADGGSTADQWALAPAERELVMTKNRANWLGFAILLTFFRERGRFPRDGAEVAAQSIAVLGKQLAVPTPGDGEALGPGRRRRNADGLVVRSRCRRRKRRNRSDDRAPGSALPRTGNRAAHA